MASRLGMTSDSAVIVLAWDMFCGKTSSPIGNCLVQS